MTRVFTIEFLSAQYLNYDLTGRKNTTTNHKVHQLAAIFSIEREG